MLRHTVSKLRAKTNRDACIGYPPGTLLVVSTGAGGGFANAPERLTVWVRMAGWPEELFPREAMPDQTKNYQYDVWEEDGNFYLERHRLEYGWTIPVGEAQKRRS